MKLRERGIYMRKKRKEREEKEGKGIEKGKEKF